MKNSKRSAGSGQRSGLSGQDLTSDRRLPTPSLWPHWLAWTLTLVAFLAICLGSLVTTYHAGMAEPGWPRHVGAWFAYPLHRMSDGGLLAEHGHRLLGMLSGALTMALVIALWRRNRRLGAVALVAFCALAIVGALRVLAGDVSLANLHSCLSPLFFAACAGLTTVTSPAWLRGPAAVPLASSRMLQRGSLIVAAVMLTQIAIGAQLRDLDFDAPLFWFPLCVWTHAINAGLTLLGVLWLRGRVAAAAAIGRRVAWQANLLACLLIVQLILGGLAWLANYGAPAWFTDYVWPVGYTVAAEGRLQALAGLLHVSIGSLCLAVATSLCLWLHRLTAPVGRSVGRSERSEARHL